MTRKIELARLNDLIRRYQAGESLYQITRETGVDGVTLRAKLVDAGVQIRSWAEQERIKGERRGADPVASFGKAEIAAALRDRGEVVSQQQPCGTYNLDIALQADRVAVEVSRDGMYGRTPTAFRERIKYLLDASWILLFVPGVRTRHDSDRTIPFLPAKVAEQIIALRDLSRREPAAVRGRYGVIRRDGELVPTSSKYFNGFPVVQSPGRQLNPTLDNCPGQEAVGV
jgi:hypothetical protein